MLDLSTERLHVCKKYPVHRSPARGAKFKLNMTRVLSLVFSQSVLSDSSMEPSVNTELLKARIPTATIKTIRNTIKTTPNEPTFMKIERSFLLVIRIRIG